MSYGTLISTVTVGVTPATSLDFVSIPNTFTDLVIVLSGRDSLTDNNIKVTFNGVTTGYSRRHLYGNGSTAGSGSGADGYAAQVGSSSETANTFGNSVIYIPNYTGTTNKSYSGDGVFENNATATTSVIIAGLWSNIAAITSISLSALSAGNFVQYSTASLYGVKSGSGGATVTP